MCVDMGGGFTLSGEVGSQGVLERGDSQGVHAERGVHRGFMKRGVHKKGGFT